MPVVLRDSGLRYFFYSNEGSPREPAHVHVMGGGGEAKIWLEPEIAVADSYGFSSAQLARILRIVNDNRERLFRAWHEHFPNGRSI